MAHGKVVRRSMGELDWIILRSKKIRSSIIEKSFPLNNWFLKEGRQIGEMDYEYFSDEYRKISDGEYYFTPDGSVFLKNEITIDDELKGKEIWFQLKTAAEMMVKINGEWAGGLDPNRNRILIKKSEDTSTKFFIEIEGYNRSKPDDERNLETSYLRGCRQVFDSGDLVLINNEVEALSFDVNIIIDTINSRFTSDFLREHLIQELGIALNMIDTQTDGFANDQESIKQVRNYLKEKIFDNKLYGKSGKVALVSHSHLDIAYYWRQIHTIQKNARTCLIQLKLMEEYPEFKYSHSQAYTFETLEKYYPEIFAEVKKRVTEGRFEIVGGMYIEPDCNLPSAESLIRQCMYGQHYFRDTFNKTVNNCWLPDVFGNSWILPQILKKSGMDYFVSNKMSTWNDTNKFPHNSFKWRGIDGSEVYASVPPTHFISWNTPEQISENWHEYQDKESCDETLNMFGFGDGGSGVTQEMLEYMRRLEHIPELPETRHITASQYLEENLADNENLDTWDGELYLEMHRGIFTTKGNLKKANRELEVLLKDCELLSTYAYLKGMNYPQEKIDELWKKVLINQFHDILTGTHITPVGRDATDSYQFVKEEGEKVLANAIEYLSSPGEESTLNILNTLSCQRKGEIFIPGEFPQGILIKGLETQIGRRKEEKGIWVQVDEVSPLSMKKFQIVKSSVESEKETWFSYDFEMKCLETPHFQMTFKDDSSIISLIRKRDAGEIVKNGEFLNKLRIYHDYPGMYDAWDILAIYKDKEDELSVIEPLKIIEEGRLYVALQAKLKVGKSQFISTVRVFKNSEKIDFEYSVDWYEKSRLAKLEFNVNLLARYAKCDTSAGIISRETHKNTSWQKAKFEVVGHKWVDLAENGFGVSLLNDSKYGYSFKPDQIGISLLKGSIRPDPHSDMEHHSFMFSMIPHNGTVEETGVEDEALALNTPVINLEEKHLDFDFIKLDTHNLIIQSIKKPQYSHEKEFILRITELKGKRGTAKAFCSLPMETVKEVNLLEDTEEIQDVILKQNQIIFDYKPFEIKSFKVTVK